MTNLQIIKLLFVILAFMVPAYVLFLISLKRKRDKRNKINKSLKKNTRNWFYGFYRIFTKTPGLKRYFKKIRKRISSIYPTDDISVNFIATKQMLIWCCSNILLLILVIVSCNGDVFFLFAGIFIAFVISTSIINMMYESMENKLLRQFSDFLNDVIDYYNEMGIIEDALYSTFETLPFELSPHIERIYDILISTDVLKEVGKYTDAAPNRFILLFAAICSSIKEKGDKTLETGQSLFLSNIMHLIDEVNVEVLKRQMNNFLFSGLVFVCLLPVFFIKPIEWWAKTYIPDMVPFYTGSAGTVVMALLIILMLVVYNLIINLKDGRVDETKDYTLLNKISEFPIIRKFLTMEINRNYSKTLRISDDLKLVGDKISPNSFLLKRIIWAIVILISFNSIVMLMNNRARENVFSNFANAFENSIVPNESYREIMVETGEEFTRACIYMTGTTEDKEIIVQNIEANTNLTHSMAEDVATVVIERITQYKQIYYRAYNILLSVLSAFIGFMIPYWLLLYQKSIMKMNMEDEVVQYQTLAIILMHVSGTTIDDILEWMERFASCFKTTITECIINLEKGQDEAIQAMKDKETFPPFRKFVSCLLNVDKVGIIAAFEKVEVDRKYYQQKRQQDNEIIMKRKASWGSLLAIVPLYLTVLGYLVVPLAYMAFSMTNIMSSSLG
ncbi:MAG: hypothetical protein K2K56_13285 [Lachnospiraceae bacterium]|nr:hypothetical protein [Lachnospiraceae bacterium]